MRKELFELVLLWLLLRSVGVVVVINGNIHASDGVGVVRTVVGLIVSPRKKLFCCCNGLRSVHRHHDAISFKMLLLMLTSRRRGFGRSQRTHWVKVRLVMMMVKLLLLTWNVRNRSSGKLNDTSGHYNNLY